MTWGNSRIKSQDFSPALNWNRHNADLGRLLLNDEVNKIFGGVDLGDEQTILPINIKVHF